MTGFTWSTYKCNKILLNQIISCSFACKKYDELWEKNEAIVSKFSVLNLYKSSVGCKYALVHIYIY